jgi:UDP-N-acetylmuramoyl-tripeptide--D-alanyl-D-alanine ligase
MSVLWTSEDAAAATQGRATQRFAATGISIDTRTIRPGDLFVALKDARDGHDFVRAALDAGAAGALVSRIPEGCSQDDALLVVPDVLDALQDLGRAGRARARARVLAVTGSVGKTSSKEMLRAVLSAHGTVHAAEASFNNHWGVPMSLATLPPDAEYGVFEIGMNHPGEISPLVKMVRPNAAIITTVVGAHTEFFKDESEIAAAKSEIFDGLDPETGVVILNRDNLHYFALARRAKELGIKTIKCFGTDAASDFRLFEANIVSGGSAVRARIAGRDLEYFIGCPGEHWVINSLAVLGGVSALGADVVHAAQDLADFSAPSGRGAQHLLDVPNGSGQYTLIDDAYNANPTSMMAGLKVLATGKPAEGARKIAVLGEMRELGDDAAALHRDLAQPIKNMGIDAVFTVGPMMKNLADALPQEILLGHFDTTEEAIDPVKRAIGNGDIVMIKGSLGIYVSKIVTALKSAPGGESPESKDV